MKYHDFIIQADHYDKGKDQTEGWVGRFKVWVISSPAGEMTPDQAVPIKYNLGDLQEAVDNLASRQLDHQGLVHLGRFLSILILPPSDSNTAASPRSLFSESYKMVGPDDGLRLRLRLPYELAVFPWEYTYTDRSAGGEGMDGFIALDPHVAFVRHQPLNTPPSLVPLKGDIKVVAAFASPPKPGLPGLKLQTEKEYLVKAFSDQAGLKPTYLMNAALQDILDAIPDAGIFHFAGHGLFDRQQSYKPGEFLGAGSLVLDDQDVEAEQLGINLRSSGVRLAVLGACNAARSESISWWDGVAPALVKADLPAVIAYQFTVKDVCAIAFSRQFYQSLAGGMSVERALCAGRIAAYNADKEGRDWGNPVLYLRAPDGQLFEGAANVVTREEAYRGAEAIITVMAKNVEAGGEVVGTEVGLMLSGKLKTKVEISGTVYGNVLGGDFDQLSGGDVDIDVNVGTVANGGKVVGAHINVLGGTSPNQNPIPGPGGKGALFCPSCGTANRPGDKFCKECGKPLPVAK